MKDLKVPVYQNGRWMASEESLLPARMVPGWTGHSKRSTLPSMLASLNVPKSDRDPLGRWSPSGSDEYVRTYKALVRSVITVLKTSVVAGGVAEKLDEVDGAHEAACLARKRGGGEMEVYEEEVEELMVRAKDFYRAYSSYSAGNPPVPPADALPLDTSALAEAPDAEPVAKYLLSVTDRGRVTRLHRADGCWRAVARSFKHFHLVHDEVVDEERYDSFCKDCWPGERRPKGPVPGGLSSDDSDDILESDGASVDTESSENSGASML